MIIRECYVRCDLCGRRDNTPSSTGAAARQRVKRYGWTCTPRRPMVAGGSQGQDVCPTCAGTDSPPAFHGAGALAWYLLAPHHLPAGTWIVTDIRDEKVAYGRLVLVDGDHYAVSIVRLEAPQPYGLRVPLDGPG